MQRTGLGHAGEIMLLVGAILAAAGAVFLVGFSFVFAGILNAASTRAGSPPPGTFAFLQGFYLVWGLLGVVGAVLGFVAYAKARQGLDGQAFGFGLAGALLPPLNIVSLLGAIFIKVAQGQAPQQPMPPQQYPGWTPPAGR